MINMGDCVEVGGAIKHQPDFSLAFSYPPSLLPIFGSSLWRDCIGTAYSVNICENTATRYLVRVQGCRRAVNEAVEAMRKLVSVQFTEGPREREDLSVQELERDVRRILGYIPPTGLYKGLNRAAVALLQEWLRMYREKCCQRTVGNNSADDSVIIIEDDENPPERIPTDAPLQVSCQNKENSEPCTASQKVDDVIIVAVVPGGMAKQPQVPQTRPPKVAQKRPLHGPVKTNKKKKRKKTPQKNAAGRCGNKRMRQRPGGAPSTVTASAVVPTAAAASVVPTECPPPPIPLPLVQRRLRPIVIDGSNVAMDHGRAFGNAFSCKGIQLCVEYFLNRGHTQVTAFVPRHRMYHNSVPHVIDHSILKQLEQKQHVTFTPSRRMDNGSIVSSYDDRFILELASRSGGVVVSNDNYRDIAGESPEFASTVRERLLMFCFVGDYFMVPKDPLGRNGPSLDEFLAFPD